ncbi:Alpha/Beta hydrolase protein [Xylariaceae sp. FL0594]|nr:Alpha/Beta hydrolase protein [Xylariaceae sp. FL0594]
MSNEIDPITSPELSSPYGQFPQPGDPFRFMPDSEPSKTWAAQFDPGPERWSWGTPKHDHSDGYGDGDDDDPLLDLQVSGLARVNGSGSGGGGKSKRTIVIEPGGPGASGTLHVWEQGEAITERLSDGQFDVLGWDPRGVNASLPKVPCYPHVEDMDNWSLLREQSRASAGVNHIRQLELADAMNNATLFACRRNIGDFGRFVSTTSVVRDLEQIRKALEEEELTAYFTSCGTGIGQIYANMFPDRVGRMILDGVQYTKDQRLLGGWGWTSLDNVADAWRDGFLGECIKAGPRKCALAADKGHQQQPNLTSLERLEARMDALLRSVLARPVPAYTEEHGPSIVTYSQLVLHIYATLYSPASWPATAQMLHELEAGNATLAAVALGRGWRHSAPAPGQSKQDLSGETDHLVICADSYDDDDEGKRELAWWDALWANMTRRSWISGDSRFLNVLPCRHFTAYWPDVADAYRGDLNLGGHALRNPVLLLSTVYDPATPLRNARRLLADLGPRNARLVVQRGYGHMSTQHPYKCTDDLAKAYILHGTLPREEEVECFPDRAPYSF